MPDPPTALTTQISGKNVFISWVAPATGGAPISLYIVTIRNKQGTFITESVSCAVTTTTCLVPITTLIAAPYNLYWGDAVYATVAARNAKGTSDASSQGNGALLPLITADVPTFSGGLY